MKNVNIQLTTANNDVSIMLVQGHLEVLRARRVELKALAAQAKTNLDSALGALDDAIAVLVEPTRLQIEGPLVELGKIYGFEPIIASTWRQLEKKGGATPFTWEQKDKKGYTGEKVTFHWIAELFSFSSHSGLDTFGYDFTPSRCRKEGCKQIFLPWPSNGVKFAASNQDSVLSRQPNVSFEPTPEITALASVAKAISAEFGGLLEEIRLLTKEIDDPDEITRRVTARLTQKTLAEAGNLPFLSGILEAMNKPLLLGSSNG
jgi:hypothetical protein